MSESELLRGYPRYLRESIKIVESTRDKRLKEIKEYSRMNAEAREEILNKFHPDYREGVKRPVRIGPNKGDMMNKVQMISN